MEIEDVFVAKIASGLQIASSFANKSFLIATFSTIASIIKSASAAAAKSTDVETLPMMEAFWSSAIFPLETILSRAFSSLATALSKISCVMSLNTT